MPITRSDLFVFSAGLAAGAVACATYPKWKGRVEPMLAGLIAGAGAAFAHASEAPCGASADSACAPSDSNPSPASDESVTRKIIPLVL